jgi:FMN-dependent NADH-azoreductase
MSQPEAIEPEIDSAPVKTLTRDVHDNLGRTQILSIQASARKNRSLTRALTEEFLAAWRSHEPDVKIVTRDLVDDPPPFVTEDWIAAVFADEPDKLSEEARAVLTYSDEVIREVAAADVIVIAAPMYNYGMPAALKAWFDQVIRIHKTFTFDLERGDKPIEPVLSGKTLVILSSRGEAHFGPGEVNFPHNHLETHIASCKHFLGVDTDPFVIHIDFQEFGDDRHAASKAAAHARARTLAGELARRKVVMS